MFANGGDGHCKAAGVGGGVFENTVNFFLEATFLIPKQFTCLTVS